MIRVSLKQFSLILTGFTGSTGFFVCVHHSNESWNPEILLILRELLDSIFRWNDDEPSKISFLEQTVSVQ